MQALKEKKKKGEGEGAEQAMLKGKLYGLLFNHVEATSIMEDVMR